MKDDGSILLDQQDCQAYVYALTDYEDEDIEVSVWDEFGSSQEMFHHLEGDSTSVRGMVSVKFFSGKLLQKLGPPDSLAYKTAIEIIPYAWTAAYRRLRPTSFVESRAVTPDFEDAVTQQYPFTSTYGTIFPDIDVVAATAAEISGDKNARVLKEALHGQTVDQLHQAVTMEQHLCMTCPCHSCLATSRTRTRSCDFDVWLSSISQCIGLILLTSLFTPIDAEGMLYRFQSGSNMISADFCTTICNCLTMPGIIECSVSELITEALHLIGHREVVPDRDFWTASSYYGQTVYPEVLQSCMVRNHGALSIICVPGSLSWKGIGYNLIESSRTVVTARLPATAKRRKANATSNADQEADFSELPANPIGPRDDYPRSQLRWWVSGFEKYLALDFFATNLATDVPGKTSDSAPRHPPIAIFTMANSRFVDCPRDSATPLANQVVQLGTPNEPDANGALPVSIVQTAGNEAMRYFTLTYGFPCVI